MLRDLGTIAYRADQRVRFTAGELREEWAAEYPQLFDAVDLRAARQRPGCHFNEWLAAVVLHHATAYSCLMSPCQATRHPRKREILRWLLSPPVLKLLTDHSESGGAGGPDLLMYAPDESHWFFCEVEETRDPLSIQQQAFFAALTKASGRPLGLIRLQSIDLPAPTASTPMFQRRSGSATVG